MANQFYECAPCVTPIHGLYGHDFQAQFHDGVTIWKCSHCGETRGFCQHEVEIDSMFAGTPNEIQFRFCSHCNQDMKELTDDYGNRNTKTEYDKYLGNELDPRD